MTKHFRIARGYHRAATSLLIPKKGCCARTVSSLRGEGGNSPIFTGKRFCSAEGRGHVPAPFSYGPCYQDNISKYHINLQSLTNYAYEKILLKSCSKKFNVQQFDLIIYNTKNLWQKKLACHAKIKIHLIRSIVALFSVLRKS